MKYKELSELAMIRLQTELENAIGHRDHYLKLQDYNLYHLWDEQVEQILNDIIELGASNE